MPADPAAASAARLSPHASCLITVDGRSLEARAGERLIDVLNRAQTPLPQVCYVPQLGPIQTCDTCLVELNGQIVRACATTIAPGMQVATASEPVKAAQAEAFDRILKNHQLYCTVCDNNNQDCTVHNTTALLHVEHQRYPWQPKPYPQDHTNPFYRYDPNQCILCGRCVEACQNYQVNETLSINWESDHPRVLWDGGTEIGGSSCVSCGHCVTVCPCNALMEKSMIGHAGYFTHWPQEALNQMIDVVKAVEPEVGYGPILQLSETEAAMRSARIRRTKTVCTYCGVGCSFDIWTKDRHILKVQPGGGPANDISTCVKGKFGWDFVNSPERLKKPLIREGHSFREAGWDEALSLVARRLMEIKAAHGPDSIGVISSSKCPNEESYLMQKFARAVIGTNNIDNCSRYCQAPATQGLFRTVGYGGDSGSIQDIAQSSLVLIVGANPAEAHPVLATRIKQAHKLRGQKLIVADLRRHEMAQRADIFFRPAPGTDLVWLSAMSRYMFDHGYARTDFLTRWVHGVDEYRASLEPFTLQHAAEVCGVPIETLTAVAESIAAAPSMCILWAMGVTQHCAGSDTSTAISNLLLVTGNYMRPGTGAYPLRGHNNVQGASDFGSMPAWFPGYEKIDDPAARARYEQGWGVRIPESRGLDNHEMVNAIYEGKLKAMYLAGEDMYIADANSNYVGGGFEKLHFFVVQDCFFTPTCRFADVVLPASPSLEKEGTFTSTERRIQRLYQVLEPLGESLPDWRITTALANKMGANWTYQHPADVMHEAASLAPLFAGIHYDRLQGYSSLQWPVAADGTDQPLLYTEKFAFPDCKARLYPLEYHAPESVEDEVYDLHLNNGRLLEHFHGGNMTGRVAGIHEETPNPFLEISPELAAERVIVSGQWVRLTSPNGHLRIRVLVSDRVQGRQIYLPLNTLFTDATNMLTGHHTDHATHTPAYKETPVRMEVLPESGENPLPRLNFRYAARTPQNGVEVERKWNRSDYIFPGDVRSGHNSLVQITPGTMKNEKGRADHGTAD